MKIIRMTEEDRRSINRMIQHKCAEFKSVIKKGVIAMLNTQYERQKLEANRRAYLNTLTLKNKHKKKIVNDVATVMKEATSTAPMGLGGASNALISTANSVANTLYDGAEGKRQETEAEQRLVSAQFLHYITSDDYAGIANQVADILSYRFQLLIFRLAAGEEGYIKLAHFFVDSMTHYAIDKLREHQEGEYVKALIEAAITPATDAVGYREWPKVDLANYRVKLNVGYRKILELDEDANAIVARCGPAVRAFLGGFQSSIHPETGKEIVFNHYTILGALNRAPILNAHGEVFTGLPAHDRHNGALSGDNKYPMLLLRYDETPADLGVIFATQITSTVLQDLHVIALKRLIPNFFSHDLPHLKLTKYDEFKYSEERFEIPWTPQRDEQWKERRVAMYSAANAATLQVTIATTQSDNKLIAMRDTNHKFDSDLAKQEMELAQIEVEQQQQQIYQTDEFDNKAQVRITAVKAAKYLALTVNKFLQCLIKCRSLNSEDLRLTAEYIEIARMTLNASRNVPLYEASHYRKLKKAIMSIEHHGDSIQHLQSIAFNHLQKLMLFLNDIAKYNAYQSQGRHLIVEKIKISKIQIRDNLLELKQLMNLANTITQKNALLLPTDYQHQHESLVLFHQTVKRIYDEIQVCEEPVKASIIKRNIEIYQLETRIIYSNICASLSVEDHELIEDECWTTGANVAQFTKKEKAQQATLMANKALKQIESCLQQVEQQINSRSHWPRYYSPSISELNLVELQASARASKEVCEKILRQIRLVEVAESNSTFTDLNKDTQAYFERAEAYEAFRQLLSFAMKHEKDRIPSIMELKNQMQQFFLSSVVARAQQVIDEYPTEYIELPLQEASLEQLATQSRKIRQTKEKIELAIASDVEVVGLISHYAKLAINRMTVAKQDISSLNEGLLSLLDSISSVSVALLDGVSSTETSFSSVEDAILQIDLLNDLFTEKKASILEAEEDYSVEHRTSLTIEYQRIYQLLKQLISDLVSINAEPFFSEEMITHKIQETLKLLKENKSFANNMDHYGSWLVVKIIQWTTQELLDKEQAGIEFHVEKAQSHFAIIKEFIDAQQHELTLARKEALQEIKGAYLQIASAEEERERLITALSIRPPSKTTIFINTLEWASSANNSEQQWLDEQIAKKYKTRWSRGKENYRSPIILATLFFTTYLSDKLAVKKEEARELYKVNQLAITCKKQFFKIKNATQDESSPENALLASKSKRIELMSRVLRKKQELLEGEITALSETRDSILSQRLKIYFTEWKKKMLNSVERSELLKAMQQSEAIRENLKASPQISQPAAVESIKPTTASRQDKSMRTSMSKDETLIEAAENYTIQEIEQNLVQLKKELDQMQTNRNQMISTNDRLSFHQIVSSTATSRTSTKDHETLKY